jgi:hypothetical protein
VSLQNSAGAFQAERQTPHGLRAREDIDRTLEPTFDGRIYHCSQALSHKALALTRRTRWYDIEWERYLMGVREDLHARQRDGREPHRYRFGCRELPSEQKLLRGPNTAGVKWQQQTGAELRHQSEIDERQCETGVGGDIHEITVERKGHTDAHGCTIDGGNNRLLIVRQHRVKRRTAELGMSSSAPLLKSLRSLPAVKVSPRPVISTALMESSSKASVKWTANASYIAMVKAFLFSGRAMVSVATPRAVSEMMLTRLASLAITRK